MSKCLISRLSESLCLNHADHSLSSSGVARLPVDRLPKACFSPLKELIQLPSRINMINFMPSSSRSITSVVWRYRRNYWRMNASLPCPNLFSSKGWKEVSGPKCRLLDEMFLRH